MERRGEIDALSRGRESKLSELVGLKGQEKQAG